MFSLFYIVWITTAVLATRKIKAQIITSNEDGNCSGSFSINDSLNGTLQTLGYPKSYPERRYCKTHLEGNDQHKIIIWFDDFDLYHPSGIHHKKQASCDGAVDTLWIYDGQDENDKILGEYCGGMKPQRLMSSGPNLTLKLTSYNPGFEARGYRAHYEFVNNFGITGGEQEEAGKCIFQFNSNSEKKGVFTSPNPGGLYPRNGNCSYIFTGTFLQRVLFNFNYFDLEGLEPCTEKSGSDFLEFSNFPNFDPCPTRRCGRFAPQQVVSVGSYFRVMFRSNDRLSGFGFSASYKFLSDEELPVWAAYLRGNSDTFGPWILLHLVTIISLQI